MSNHAIMNTLMQRKQSNLLFFQQHFRVIYEKYVDHELQYSELQVGEDGGFNLKQHGKMIYQSDAVAAARREVTRFIKTFRSGARTRTVDEPLPANYASHKLFSLLAKRVTEQSPVTDEKDQPGFVIPEFYPLVVVMGIGLGFHIEQLLRKKEIFCLYLFEPDEERFVASLYTVDWAAMLMPFVNTNKKTMEIYIGADDQRELHRRLIWNFLVKQCPHFPLLTLFFNHQGDGYSAELINETTRDMYAFMQSWGTYDDELNQMRQVFYNLKQGVNVIGESFPNLSGKKVVIVGSGPSLDSRAPILKAVQNDTIIASCGSGITVLFQMGIRPQIHFELESDGFLTNATLDSVTDADYIDDILLIGPVCLDPVFVARFKRQMLYVKASHDFEPYLPKQAQMPFDGPSCVNLGFSFFLQTECQAIYLFGADLGFINETEHHAAGSAYYDEQADPTLRDINDCPNQQAFRAESVTGESILTRKDFYTSRWALEQAIIKQQGTGRCPEVLNCSSGLKIEQTVYLPLERIEADIKSNAQAVERRWIDDAESTRSEYQINQAQYLEQVKAIKTELSVHCEKIKQLLPESPPDSMAQLCLLATEIPQYLQEKVYGKQQRSYCLMRGSVWHLIYILYAHALRIDLNEAYRWQTMSRYWLQAVNRFLSVLPDHFETVLLNTVNDLTDFNRSIKTALEHEPFIDEWAEPHDAK